jgi:ubiquinone/menaquinone biosynthesis C-methylase UbiE
MPDPHAADPAIDDADPAQRYNFDRVASEYEETRYLPPAVARHLATLLVGGIRPADWYLDAGAGTGRIGRALAAQHGRTVGVDISTAMLRHFRDAAAANSRPRLALVLGDVRALPFPDGVFAGILTSHVLHLISDWRGVLAELWRVLRPGGTLTIALESRSRSVVTARFLAMASEQRLLGPTLDRARGAEIASALQAWTEEIGEHRPPGLAWTSSLTAEGALDLLARRTYSSLWDIPDAALVPLLTETAEWTSAQFGARPLAEIEECSDCAIVLYTGRKPVR